MGLGETVLRILGALVALVFVLLLAWFILQWLGKRMNGLAPGTGGRLLNVLDRVSFGKGGSLLLVRVDKKVFLIAVSEHAIEKIAELDDPDENLRLPDVTGTAPFGETFKEALAKFTKPKDGKPGGKL